MSEFGVEEAQRLLDADWRQGSTFVASGKLAATLGVADGSIMIVLSQSCVVVSRDLAKDPRVEVACLQADFQEAFRSNHEIAVGKHRTRLHVQLDGHPDGDRFVLDINTRQFMPREILLELEQSAPTCTTPQADRVAGWISRSYTRSAWPNRLVELFRSTKVHDNIYHCLKLTHDGAKLHAGTRAIFARWLPEEEAKVYSLVMDFVCDSDSVTEQLEAAIQKRFGTEDAVIFKDDTLSVEVYVKAADTVLFSDFDGSRRMTEWDVFTDLAETTD